MSTKEAARDVPETAFTPMLRALIRGAPPVVAAAFVDDEGECVDYCSTSVTAFDAKVIGAQVLVLSKMIHDGMAKIGGGAPLLTQIRATERDFFARRVSDEYTLVVVTRPVPHHGETIAMIETTVSAFRVEAGIDRPAFEGGHREVYVEVRKSPWGFAPTTLYQRGDRVEIVDVLGRWTEPQGRLGFLTRTQRGDEIALFVDPRTGRWEMR